MNLFPLTGQSGCRAHWKSACGPMAGCPKNHRIIYRSLCHCKGMDAGAHWNPCHYSHGKGWQSHWTPLPPPMTNAPSLDFRALCSYLLLRDTPEERYHYGHGTRSTDQSPSAVPRPHHTGPTCPHPDQRDRTAWLSMGSLEKPKEKTRI